MIILNTICRKAAQSAYVHPVPLDEISRKFAIKIEACTSIAQLEALDDVNGKANAGLTLGIIGTALGGLALFI